MTRLSRADVDHEHTLVWLMQRDDAETRACPTCLVRPGSTCRNVHTGLPLERQAAHVARLRDPSAPPALPSSAAPRPLPLAA